MAVADIAHESDIDAYSPYGDVVVMEGGVNTAGNLLLVNEQGVLRSPSIPTDGLEIHVRSYGFDSCCYNHCWSRCVWQLGCTMIKAYSSILT